MPSYSFHYWRWWVFYSNYLSGLYISETENSSIRDKLDFLWSRVLGKTFSYAMAKAFVTPFLNSKSLFIAMNLHMWIAHQITHLVPIPLLPGAILSKVNFMPGILLEIRNLGLSLAWPSTLILYFLLVLSLICSSYVISTSSCIGFFLFAPLHEFHCNSLFQRSFLSYFIEA